MLFSDFQCPYCKGEAEMLRKNLIATYPTQVRLYFMDFPIEQLHPWAKPSSIGGRFVFGQDPAFDFLGLLRLDLRASGKHHGG